VNKPGENNGEKLNWRSTLTASQVELVEEAKKTGLFSAFCNAVVVAKDSNLPQNLEKFFITVLRTAVPKQVPRFALKRFIKEWPGTRVEYFASQQIGIIVVEGVIRAFIPSFYVSGRTIRNLRHDFRGVTSAPQETFEAWIRTKNGYVSSSGALLEELRSRSLGSFARPVL
jgi:hypothetical protein